MHKIEQAVILAGGLGTRLRPLTHKTPKPMAPISGKPFLQYQLELLKNNGLKDIVLCVGYLADRIIEYFDNGSTLGIKIKYSIEDEPLGTGGALRNAQQHLSEYFFVLNGDTYLPIDYSLLAKVFLERDKLSLVTVFTNKGRRIRNNVKVNSSGLVVKYSKGAEDRDMNGVDAGCSIMKKAVIHLVPDQRVVSFEEEIYPILIERKQVIAYRTDQQFYDIGTPEGMQTFENVLKHRIVRSE